MAPLCSKVAAIINPIPVPPPVTTATNPDCTMTLLSHLVGSTYSPFAENTSNEGTSLGADMTVLAAAETKYTI